MVSDRYFHSLDPAHAAGPLAANNLLVRLDLLTRRRSQLLRDYRTINRNLAKQYSGPVPPERLTRLQREEQRLLARFAAIEARIVAALQDYGEGAKPDWLRKLARQQSQQARQQTKQQSKVVVMQSRRRNHFKRQGCRVPRQMISVASSAAPISAVSRFA